MRKKIVLIILVLFIALITDQVSVWILVAQAGIAGETNPIIKYYWNNFGELWILGDIMITCLALGVTVLIIRVD